MLTTTSARARPRQGPSVPSPVPLFPVFPAFSLSGAEDTVLGRLSLAIACLLTLDRWQTTVQSPPPFEPGQGRGKRKRRRRRIRASHMSGIIRISGQGFVCRQGLLPRFLAAPVCEALSVSWLLSCFDLLQEIGHSLATAPGPEMPPRLRQTGAGAAEDLPLFTNGRLYHRRRVHRSRRKEQAQEESGSGGGVLRQILSESERLRLLLKSGKKLGSCARLHDYTTGIQNRECATTRKRGYKLPKQSCNELTKEGATDRTRPPAELELVMAERCCGCRKQPPSFARCSVGWSKLEKDSTATAA